MGRGRKRRSRVSKREKHAHTPAINGNWQSHPSPQYPSANVKVIQWDGMGVPAVRRAARLRDDRLVIEPVEVHLLLLQTRGGRVEYVRTRSRRVCLCSNDKVNTCSESNVRQIRSALGRVMERM